MLSRKAKRPYGRFASVHQLAPRVGIEPTTNALTARCSTAELSRSEVVNGMQLSISISGTGRMYVISYKKHPVSARCEKPCYAYGMNRIKKAFHVTLGLILIVIGLAGLILPILDGLIPLLLGFILLSFEIPSVERHLARIAYKTKFTGDWYEKLERWMRKVFGK